MKRNFLSKLALGSLVLATGIAAGVSIKTNAAPLQNQLIELNQPNGQAIECYASGDEIYNYLHDSNGRAIVKDTKTGYYVYGKYVKDSIIPSRERVKAEKNLENVKDDSRVRVNELKVSKEALEKDKKEMLGVSNAAPTKNVGKLNNIVIFIKFSDQDEITRTTSTYERMFNSKDQASLYNYYREASYNQLEVNTSFYPNPQGNQILSYTDSHPRSYYSNVPSNERGMKEQTLLKSAVDAVKGQIPSDLNVDSDNDGRVDNVCFIIKGGTDGWSSLLWPHKWNMFYQNPQINGKDIDTYNFQLEDFTGDNGVGVLSHEMFHTLGAPDLYHYNYDGKVAVGPWDVMDQTNSIPQSMGAYMKMYYGKWMDKINEIDKPGKYSVKSLNDNEDNNSYIIKSPNSDSEYFVVEYRKKQGLYESGLQGEGLLVYRINKNYEGQGNSSSNDEVYLYRPSGSLYDVGDIYSAALGNDRTSIDSNDLFLSNGMDSGISLENINISEDKANFNVVINGEKGDDDNGETGDGETGGEDGDKELPLKYKVNFDDSKIITINDFEITGECVSSKKIDNIEIEINGGKYNDAEFSELKDVENKYEGYDLSKAAFKIKLYASSWFEGNFPYKIIATTEDGEKTTLKEGTLIVKEQDENDLELKSKFNFSDCEAVSGCVNLTGECAYKRGISSIKLFINGYEYSEANRYAISDPNHEYDGYDISNAGFSFDLDVSRCYNYDYPYQIIATDSYGVPIVIKEGYLSVRNCY